MRRGDRMSSAVEVRHFLPTDLPLVRRLTAHGVCLDTATGVTRGVNATEGALLGAVPMADFGTPTFVIREGDVGYVAQFRHRAGDSHGQIVYIAPDISSCDDEYAWEELLEAMIIAAGRRGAAGLRAEVNEDSAAFMALRATGFASYVRQEIWMRDPAPLPDAADLVRPATELDSVGIMALHAAVTPRLMMQVESPETRGSFVYERAGRIVAHFSVQEGKYGLFVQPLVHPDGIGTGISTKLGAVLASVIRNLPRAERHPVYFCVRRYQSFLHGALENLAFADWTRQALMVRHTVSRVEQAQFAFKHGYAFEGFGRTPVANNTGNKAMKGIKRTSDIPEKV
jgi:hypothetical protein